MFEIVFSKRANETFDAIEAQLIARWGFDIAIDFELRTLKVLETISDSPFLYQAVNTNSEVRRV